jgi:hypothetical protein
MSNIQREVIYSAGGQVVGFKGAEADAAAESPTHGGASVEVLSFGIGALSASDSGKTYLLKLSEGEGYELVLPPVAAGLYFKFIVGQAPMLSPFAIVAPASALILKGYLFDIEAAAVVEGAGSYGVSFADSGAVVGDFAEFACDGTNWIVNGVSHSTDGVAFLAP